MAKHELDDASRAFTRWRASRRPGKSVPDELWALAVEAARAHGIMAAARTLRLNPTRLKRRMDAEGGDAPAPAQAFVELPVSLVGAPESIVELVDVAGSRLRLVLRGAKPHEVAAVACELWGVRA